MIKLSTKFTNIYQVPIKKHVKPRKIQIHQQKSWNVDKVKKIIENQNTQ